MEKVRELSKSTGFHVNPSKCKAYYGGVKDKIKAEIQAVTSFIEGPLPFKYLGVPLTSKKTKNSPLYEFDLETCHVHETLSTKLLSYASRIQLIRNGNYELLDAASPFPKEGNSED
ncbi:hypothetical protein KIW84_033499 [Lathyrus oleraceus]|uniref:Reverse transcriptase n=1 Tax=Pisum sativum TaxID=3888 RepID=A0A9D4XWS8_PEA|nr:hypothetical protein KIW84_033499 [Pisum sativum]